MPVPLVVPDASVLLKWVLPCDTEPDADKALLLRAAIQDEVVDALLPALWLYEVGNTIARRFPMHASSWLSALMKFGLEEASPSQVWLAKTLELTVVLGNLDREGNSPTLSRPFSSEAILNASCQEFESAVLPKCGFQFTRAYVGSG